MSGWECSYKLEMLIEGISKPFCMKTDFFVFLESSITYSPFLFLYFLNTSSLTFKYSESNGYSGLKYPFVLKQSGRIFYDSACPTDFLLETCLTGFWIDGFTLIISK